MKGKLGDKQRLLHIVDAIIEIENYTANIDFDTFLRNSMMRFASIKQIEIIGEAANLISEDSKNKFTEIEWRQIIGMRHVLVHEYFGVDNGLVWQIIINDIPALKAKIENIITSINDE
ncbi:HepT-like ribonuclease domain-containing protein [Solitalea koreensis]|uniref:Uncharacterized conserved protein, contains HEPN domain n=1 Tax=Solitalea koreensis TaxID=543615 RepID=A0A521C7K0_9SPHI|nr:DUF86 domain-containing protein [Solitalea koreensis]SMO54690.1 Uncharacterized conserved protein, contains HEPN domain [Solitalea koreensis]